MDAVKIEGRRQAQPMTAQTSATQRQATEIEATKPALAGLEQPSQAALVHELVEALTATGNYLAATAQMLDSEADPPNAVLREVLEKGLTQFSRATEAVRQLSKSLSPRLAIDKGW